MMRLFHQLVALSAQCASIAPPRRAHTRHTWLRRHLARINLPLQSVVGRVRRGLVQCDAAEFERHVRAVLLRFRVDLVTLVRSLDSATRTEELMVLQRAVMACDV